MRHASRTAPSVSNVQQPLYVGLLHSEGETPWRESRIRSVVPSGPRSHLSARKWSCKSRTCTFWAVLFEVSDDADEGLDS
jgi:hypothetical protein